MKKILLSLVLLSSVATFAQKDELKTLNKISSKSNISEKDYKSYLDALSSLKEIATLDADKDEYTFYNSYSPIVHVSSLGQKINSTVLLQILNDENYASYLKIANDSSNPNFEKIRQGNTILLPLIRDYAFKMNSESNFDNAAFFFYNIYKLDKKDGQSLENASILAVQAKNYKMAEKYYRELYESDYTGSGTFYYATNKMNQAEEKFSTARERDIFIKAGSHTMPREEKILSKKDEYIKAVAMLAAQNGDIDNAKKAYTEAKKFDIKDVPFLLDEANLYYQSKDYVTYEKLLNDILVFEPNNVNVNTSLGYAALLPEGKIVEEINASTAPSQRAKYDKLLEERKGLFKKALPYFEKAYKFDSENVDIKNILRTCYEALGMKDKATTIK
ncbi:tetratricopeptide repeat protein [Flavobacterium sp. N2270]|uniref:tetratricopeptide repeat protein n=1 Tax=Flavobacterium sp. N2270 TaxID=2986831 RepID=UPI0022243712|nr:hypothetical protein [Flavobacterium sp. N2270]